MSDITFPPFFHPWNQECCHNARQYADANIHACPHGASAHKHVYPLITEWPFSAVKGYSNDSSHFNYTDAHGKTNYHGLLVRNIRSPSGFIQYVQRNYPPKRIGSESSTVYASTQYRISWDKLVSWWWEAYFLTVNKTPRRKPWPLRVFHQDS